MNAFWTIIEWVSDKLKVLGAACLIGMSFLTCADVVGRYFGHPISGAVEIVGFMATLAVAMALPYTHKIEGHVGVEIIVRMFSSKTQTIINLGTRILSTILFGILTWRMIHHAHSMQKSGEVSMNLQLPEYIIIYIISLCLLIFTLVIFQNIIDLVKNLKSK